MTEHPDEWFIKKFKSGHASVADMVAFVAKKPEFVTQLINQRDSLANLLRSTEPK